MQKLTIGNKLLDLNDCYRILFRESSIDLDEGAMLQVKDCFSFLSEFSQNKVIYGVNTGFGPMAQYIIPKEQLKSLQINLIRSHAAGSGDLVDDRYIRATILARLNSLLQAKSGVHPSTVQLLAILLNAEVYPCIYAHGGVGASGDLVQLAHLALSMIGEGEVKYKGELRDTAEVYEELNIEALSIHIREGIALINGTSAMTGVGIVNLIQAKKLLKWSIWASSAINEIVESYDDHYSAPLNEVKRHQGQQQVAAEMRAILKDSQLCKKRADFLYQANGANGQDHRGKIADKVQEYYSVRCVPQILGPVWDSLEYTENVLINELNSVNDNPIVDVKNKDVYHGGNFHGDYISMEMDKLKIAISKLSMLCERQLNFLLNDKLNSKLPPFVNLGVIGLNFGMQGAQFTATSTVAENQSLSYPMYLHSIPNNNDNQDIVSMGFNAAYLAKKVIDNTFEVLAIELMTIIQAIDHLQIVSSLSSKSKSIYFELRAIVPIFEQDSIKYREIKKMKEFLMNSPINS